MFISAKHRELGAGVGVDLPHILLWTFCGGQQSTGSGMSNCPTPCKYSPVIVVQH